MMKPEAQRIAIAQACGWSETETLYRYQQTDPRGRTMHIGGFYTSDGANLDRKSLLLAGFMCGPVESYQANRKIPDYGTDLNAMHEAEKVLTPDQFHDYRGWLWKITTAHLSDKPAAWIKVADRAYLTATAPQRAEAFLRTIEKWQES